MNAWTPSHADTDVRATCATDAVDHARRGIVRAAAAVVGAMIAMPRAIAATATEMRVQRLAWAGVRLQLGTTDLYIDPLLDPKVWDDALPDPLVPIDAPAGGARFALVTHRHPDHYDPVALRRALGDTGTLVCMADVAPVAAQAGFRVRTAALYEPVLIDDFTVTAVPASDGYGDPQVSWVVAAGGRRVIHCGDTLWHGAWWRIARQHGPFEAAFLPVNGARFKWRQPVSEIAAVLTPEQAVAAAVVLGAKRLVPIHFGVRGADGYEEVAQPLAGLRTAARARGVDVRVVAPGGWLDW